MTRSATTVKDTASTTDVVVQLRDVEKIYHMGKQEVRALAGISVSIRRGSFWAIMGPSGSGKSTMLNLLGCLDRPTAGTYLLDGQEIAVLNDDALSEFRLRHLGFIFQNFNLIPQLTVRENIELPLYYLGWDERASAQRAVDLANELGLGDRLLHKPTELSGGQQQRVAIARALANDPSILLADEPTGNLDSTTGQQILNSLLQLNRQGKTILIVTHDPDIADYATYRLHLRDGLIEKIDGRS